MYKPNVPLAAVALLLAYLCYHVFRTYWRLKDVPGPFLARFTNLLRVSWVRTRRAHEIHIKLHDEYGDCVRFGPNMVSISDPTAIATVYPMRPGFPKGDFYKALMPYTKSGSLPAVFNTRDEKLHKQLKNPIAPLFSLTNVVTFESFVDQVLKVLFHQLDERYVQSHETFDLGSWLQFFAFDVMGTLTFSKRYGFLETGKDVNGMLETIWKFMTTTAPRWPFGFSILKIVADCCSEREQKNKDDRSAADANQVNNRDMLSRFIEIQSTNPSVPPWAVTAWTFSNVIAGSDTTATVMRTVWYNLLTHPSSIRRLHEELIEAERKHALSRPFPKWNEVRGLPYLDACINEAVRLHPPFCLPFERVVPEGGVTVCGQFFEAGTVLGMSPYVVNRHRPTFGEDVDAWRPERWLGHDEEHHRKLEQSVLTFGAGRRTCLGKNIALLELKKLVPALLLNYEIELIDPNTFVVENSWFFRQKGLNVRIKRRVAAE